MHQNVDLGGNGLIIRFYDQMDVMGLKLNDQLCQTLYRMIPAFYQLPPKGRRLMKTFWEKEKMLVNQHFLLFPQCFLIIP